MLQVIATVLLYAAPLTAAWLYALMSGALGTTTYFLPFGLAGAILGGFILLRAAARAEWALLMLLVFAAVFLNVVFRIRELGNTGLDAQNSIKIATWIVLLAVAALNWRRFGHLLTDPVLAGFGAFATIALLSAAYSPVPLYTAACAIGFLAYVGFACLISVQLEERTIVLALVWGLAAYFCATWAAAALIPDFAFLLAYADNAVDRLQGIAGHPNVLAKQVAVFFLLLIASRQRRYIGRCLTWGLAALGLVTLLATNSRTALLATFLAWGLVELRSRRLLLAAFLGSLVLLGLVALAGSTGAFLDIDALLGLVSRTGDASEVLTLTGRTELWEFVWQKILEKPFLGYGFNAFEPVVSREWFGAGDAAVGAHNTLLQALFTVGFIGTVPLAAAFAVLVHRWVTRPNALRDLFTSYLLLAGITEVEITSVPVLLTLAALLVFALDSAHQAAAAPHRTPGSDAGQNVGMTPNDT